VIDINKMKFIAYLILLMLLISNGCSRKKDVNESLEKIAITGGNKSINYECISIDKNKYLDPDQIAEIFKTLIDKEAELIVIAKDESIFINLGDLKPNKVTLYDHYINPTDGRNLYGDADFRELETVDENKNIYSFTLGSTSAEVYESNLSGDKYRGLRLQCELDDLIYEYFFVVITHRKFDV